jgi:hypothetical protein
MMLAYFGRKVRMSRILIASTARGVSAVKDMLDIRHELTIVTGIEDALEALKSRAFDLIMISVQFDDSRMFDLLYAIRQMKSVDTPVICFCVRDTQLTRMMHQSIYAASTALGAWMYLDQHEFNVTKDPVAEMQRIIERCISGAARKEIQASRIEIHKQREELLRLRIALQSEKWSTDLEEQVSQLREKLSQVLLNLSELLIKNIAHQERTDESKNLEDRVSPPVKLDENAIGRDEAKMDLQESEQLGKEQKVIPEEEARARKWRKVS